MKQIFLIICIPFVFLTTTNAEEFFNCIDSNGNTVISSFPQDGMKCVKRGSNEEQRNPNISSKTNLCDICSDYFHELEDLNDEITTLEKSRSKLQREQLDNRITDVQNNWNQRRQWGRTNPVNDEINKLNNELSILNQKKHVINQDIRLYKCNELKNDLSKLNKKDGTTTDKRYKSDVFIHIKNY